MYINKLLVMKNFFILISISSLVLSCTKSEEKYTKIGPVNISVTSDTSVKYFVQNTDIPLMLDSMTLHLYGSIDDINNYYYVENVAINPKTTLEQFCKSSFTYNVPQQNIKGEFNLSILHRWSTRLETWSFKTNANTTNSSTQVLNPTKYPNNVIVTNGLWVGLDVLGSIGNPVLVPSVNINKLLVSKKNINSAIKLFAIKKNSIITTPPLIKNYDGRMIPFSESNNYYYLYFYPMTTVSANLTTIFKDLLFYNNLDFYTSISSSVVNNFIQSGYERVYIVEYIKDGNGRIVPNLNNLIRTNDLY